MAKVLINEENLTNIANAIREKFGKTNKYKPSEMANALKANTSLEQSFAYFIDGRYSVTKLPDTMTQVGDYVFYKRIGWSGIEELPDSITSIGKYAFADCNYLPLKRLPKNLTSVGTYAFNNNYKMIVTELPESLTSMGTYAFAGCTQMALTKLPDRLTTIPDGAFASCDKLMLDSLPSNLTSIGSYAFKYATNMTLSKGFPDSLTSIGSDAFISCENLVITKIPSGVTEIKSWTFKECTALSEITCEGAITSIGSYAFNQCSNLSQFVLPNITKVPTLSNTNAFGSTLIATGAGYIYVPDVLVDSFKSASNWSTYAEQIRPISSLNNILDLDQQHFPITTDGNLTVDYDATSQTFTLNGTVEESHGFNIPITQELLGTYTLSYNHTETDKAFYISIDNKTETMLNGWGTNTKTFTLTEQPSQLMFWFDYSDSTPERNVYTDYKINLVLEKGENE